MRTYDILLSGLNITEDDYNYKGQFILSSNNKSINVDISELENTEQINEIRKYFDLEEPADEIRKIIMDMVMEKAMIVSRNSEGEKYELKAMME